MRKQVVRILKSRAFIMLLVAFLLAVALTYALQVAAVWQVWGAPHTVSDYKEAKEMAWSMFFESRVLWFSVLWLIAFFAMLVGIINRFVVSLAIFLTSGVAFVVAEYEKISLRNEGIVPADISEIASSAKLAKMIDPQILKVTLISLGAVIIVMFVLLIVARLINKGRLSAMPKAVQNFFQFVGGQFFKREQTRIAVSLVSMAVVVTPFFIPAESYEEFYGVFDRSRQSWSSSADAAYNGPIMTFTSNLKAIIMTEPADYSKKTMIELADKYEKEAAAINESRGNANFDGQTVIYVLSESLTNPKNVPGLKINQDPLTNIEDISAESPASGKMLSSGYGAGTANVEYMTLTGTPLSAFSPAVDTPYVQLTGHVNEMPSILSYFDKSATVHPYNGSLYNRRGAYHQMGMQKFLTTDKETDGQLNHLGTWFQGGNVKDSEAYQDTLDLISKSKDESQFLQLLTMQNHLPYYDGTYTGENAPIKVTKALPGENTNEQVTTYLNGLYNTDLATRSFINALNELDRPVTVVWYGDHWPGIFTFVRASEKKNEIKAHKTQYFIWQNDAAKAANGSQSVDKSVVSPNEFNSMMLQVNNMNVTPFFALQTEVANKLPTAITYRHDAEGNPLFVVDGKEKPLNKLTTHQQKLWHDLELINYDSSIGDNYLSKTSFFKNNK